LDRGGEGKEKERHAQKGSKNRKKEKSVMKRRGGEEFFAGRLGGRHFVLRIARREHLTTNLAA